MKLFPVILAMLQSQPVYKEDTSLELRETKRSQLQLIAQAEERAVLDARGWPGPPLELAQLMNAILRYESGGSLRIHAGDCRRNECDRGRAAGLFQQHVTRYVPQSLWEQIPGVDQESTNLSARIAAQTLVRARASCRTIPGDWVRMTIAHYAGRGCVGYFRGIELRVAEFHRLGRFR